MYYDYAMKKLKIAEKIGLVSHQTEQKYVKINYILSEVLLHTPSWLLISGQLYMLNTLLWHWIS